MEKKKIYRLVGLDIAMNLIRPGASYEICNGKFTRWDDPRPCPEWEEVAETINKLKSLEDSISTIWLQSQIDELNKNSAFLQDYFNVQIDSVIEDKEREYN